MIASIKVDISGALAQLQRARQDQIPYAASRAINDCADKAVTDLVAWVQSIFNFRGSGAWVKSKWFKSKWSNKNDNPMVAYVLGMMDYLLLHEQGGIKTPHRGASLAVPLGTLRFKRIPDSMRPRYLLGNDPGALLKVQSKTLGPRSKTKQLASYGQAFLLDLHGKRFIAMRTDQSIGIAANAARLRGIRLLYYLTPSVRIVPRLRMLQSVEKTVAREFNAAFARRMADAIRTAH